MVQSQTSSAAPADRGGGIRSAAASGCSNQSVVGVTSFRSDFANSTIWGIWEVQLNGGVLTEYPSNEPGGQFYGSVPGLNDCIDDISGMAAYQTVQYGVEVKSGGYWLVGQDGGVFAFGSAEYYGNAVGQLDTGIGEAITGIAATPDGAGYWLMSNYGRIWAFGDATIPSNYSQPGFVSPYGFFDGFQSTNLSQGFWMMNDYGDMYGYGAAGYYGGEGSAGQTFVSFAATSDNGGYWLTNAAGQVYAPRNASGGGDSQYYGNASNPTASIVGIVGTPDSGGYWEDASDWSHYAIGDAGSWSGPPIITPPPAAAQPINAIRGSGNPTTIYHSPCAGGPVDCETGDFWKTYTDVSVPGRGPPLALTRTYNSLESGTLGPFGYGWTDTYSTNLVVNTGAGTATVTLDDGSTVVFIKPGSTWVAPTWSDSTLVSNSNGTWTFVEDRVTTFSFNASGQMTSVQNLNGYALTLTYSGSELTTVTDPAGRTLSFAYNSNGRVSSLTDPDNQTKTQYSYNPSNPNQLAQVTDPDGNVTKFTYTSQGSLNNLLQTITTPNGNVTTAHYNSSGETITVQNAVGETTSYTWFGGYSSSSGGTTTITGWDGSQTLVSFSNGVMNSQTTAFGTPHAALWTYGYDPTTFGMTSSTDPNDKTTNYKYDQYGNLLSETDPNGNTTTYTYNQFNEPLSVTDPTGVTTQSTYDTHGNVLTKTVVPNPGGATGSNDWATAGLGTTIATEGIGASCPSTTLCVATDDQGDVLTSLNPTGGASTWTVTHVDAPNSTLRVSCPSTSLCVAVDSLGNVFSSTNPSAATWSSFDADGSNPIGALSCPSTSLCVAADGAGNVLTSTNPSGGPGSWTVTHVSAGGNPFWSLSCASSSLCVAGTAQGGIVTSTNPTGGATAWSSLTDIDGTNGITSLSCPSASECVGGDTAGNALSSTNPTGGASAWTKTALTTIEFNVTCYSTSACIGFDYHGNSFTSTNPTAGAWTAGSNVDAAGINSVTCASRTLCVALDAVGGIATSTYALGGVWSVTTGVDPPTTYDPVYGMNCVSMTLCVGSDALGNALVSTDPAGGASTYVKENISGSPITSLSCPTTTLCVGSDLAGHILTTSNAAGGPSSWTSTEIDTNDPLKGRQTLFGVSCNDSSGIFCMAIDDGAVLYSTNPTGGASAWTTVDVDHSVPILGIACPSGTTCIGVDANGQYVWVQAGQSGGAGTIYKVSSIGLPAGTSVTSLACTASTDCLAGDTNGDIILFSSPNSTTDTWSTDILHVDGTATIADISCPNNYYFCMAVDSKGQILSSTAPDSPWPVWSIQSPDGTNPLSVVSCASESFCVAGDTVGNVLTYDVGSETTTYTYDDAYAGDVTAVTDPLGRVTNYSYDSYGNVTLTSTNPSPNQQDTTLDVYDILGRKACETNPVGYVHEGGICPAVGQPRAPRTTTWVYNGDSEVTSVTNPDGNTTSSTYDGDGNTLTTTDALGNVTKMTYDGLDRLLTTTTGYGTSVASTTSATYDVLPGSSPCSTSVTGALYCEVTTNGVNQPTVAYYDVRGDEIESIAPGNVISTASYDGAGNVLTATNPAGTATNSYDSDDNLTQVNYSNAQSGFAAAPNVSLSYNADNERTSMTDGTGTTIYAYDQFDRPISVTNGAGAEVQYAYNLANEVTAITYPNGQTVHQGYDGAGEMTSVSDFQGRTTTYAYPLTSPLSTFGSQVTASLPNQETISTASDAAGAPAAIDASSWSTATIDAYSIDSIACPASNLCVAGDNRGNVVTSGDPISGASAWTKANVDGTAAIKAMSCPSTALCVGVDGSGNVINSTNPTGGATAWTKASIDGSTALSSISCPTDNGITLCVAGDSAGNIFTATSPTGGASAWTKANVDGTSSIKGMSCPSIVLCVAVDSAGNVVTSTDLTGGPSAWTTVNIDGATPINSVSCPSTTFCVAVDNTGHALTTSNPTGPASGWTKTDFDSYNALHSVDCPSTTLCIAVDASLGTFVTTAPASGSWSLGNGYVGLAEDVSCPTTSLCVAVYSPGIVSSTTNPTSGAVNDTFSVNADEQIASVDDSQGSSTSLSATYAYNANSQLASSTASPPNPPGDNGSFGYDTAGDATSTVNAATGSQVTQAFNTQNEITSDSYTGEAITYGYDALGDRTSVTPSPGQASTYAFNQVGKMVSETPAGGTAVSYTYNGDGLRMAKISGSTTENYVWNTLGSNMLADGSTYFIYGPNGQVIEQEDSSSSGDPLFFVNGLSGSTQALLNLSGSTVASYSYSPYGATVAKTGTASTPIGYDGAYTDPETGFLYLVNRYYDPSTGQFLSVDPDVAQTGQPYAGFGDDPINQTDPLGNWYSGGTPGEQANPTPGGGAVCTAGCGSPQPTYPSAAASNSNPGVDSFLQYCASSPSAADYCQQLLYAQTTGDQADIECLAHGFCSTSSATNAANADYVCLASDQSGCETGYGSNYDEPDVNFVTVCVAVGGVVCGSLGGTVHVSVGYQIGVPGVAVTAGSVQGASADQYLCGESVTNGGNVLGGYEVGGNPGRGDEASGIQVGTPGWSYTNTWGTCG